MLPPHCPYAFAQTPLLLVVLPLAPLVVLPLAFLVVLPLAPLVVLPLAPLVVLLLAPPPLWPPPCGALKLAFSASCFT